MMNDMIHLHTHLCIHFFFDSFCLFPKEVFKFIIIAGLLEKGYLFILVNLPERVEELDVANIPHETLLSSCTSVDDVHRCDADNTSDSNDATNDATEDDSLHHVLLPPFMMDC